MVSLLPFLVIIVAFWFLLIRPQQKKQRQVREMQSTLSVGDEVMLTSGIYATVVEINDDHVVVSIADGVSIKVVRAAIGQTLPKETLSLEKADADQAPVETVAQPEENE